MQKMEKVKVLHIITRLDNGGSAENTFLTVTGLNKAGWDVSLMSGPVDLPSQDRRKQIEKQGVEYIHMPDLVRNVHPFKDLEAFYKMYRLLRKRKFDIVHTHTSKAGFLGRLAAWLARTPLIIHTPHGHVFFGYFGAFKTRIILSLEKWISRITGQMVALTSGEKRDYVKYGVCDTEKITVICSGIELNKFKEASWSEKRTLRKELGIPENAKIVGTVGRLVPVKGPVFLIDAAKFVLSKHPNTFFLFVGDGELKHELVKRARKLDIEHQVLFVGWRDDVARILSLFDIFVFPSLNEGMGRVLVEAMTLGKPIVASDVGGIPDLVIHGKNGFLVCPKNPLELAKGIKILIEDKNQREHMGECGKEMAWNFSKDKMIEEIVKLYSELMSRKNMSFSAVDSRI